MFGDIRASAGDIFASASAGELDALVLVGSDPVGDGLFPSAAKAALDKVPLIQVGAISGEIGRRSEVQLPAAAYTEVDGTFINMEGRIRVAKQPIRSIGQERPLWKVMMRLVQALRLYRHRPLVLLAGLLLSVLVHASLAVCFYWSARGLRSPHPDFATHCLLVPLAMLVGSLPLTLNGIGALEGAVEYLYAACTAAGTPIPAGQGLLVCLAYRLFTVVTALFGAWYYITVRRMGSVAEARRHNARTAVEDGAS